MPKVEIVRIDCRVNGDEMEIEGVIQNLSEYQAEVVKIMLLGQEKPVDIYLQPEQEREVILYSGSCLKDDSLDKSYLEYKNESGDYFRAHHYVDFSVQPDDKYIVHHITFVPPIQDI